MITVSDDIRVGDLDFILRNPWEITQNEWGLEGNERIEYCRQYAAGQVKKAELDGFSRIWKTMEGEAVAILCFYKIDDKRYETMFIGSKHMDKHGLKVSIALKQTLQEKTKTYPGCTCGLYSGSTHPKQIKWFGFIGFAHKPSEDRGGGIRYFEFTAL